MKRILTIIVLLTALSATFAQTGVDWTQYGFKAEPGVAVGTPCVGNLMARFWYRNFGISGCGLYLPSGVTFLNGSGGEADVMFKFISGGRQKVQPYIALGYGNSSVSSTVGTQTISLRTNYVGLQVGAYYGGAFAQVGVGVGSFYVNTARSQAWPLLQIGYVTSIGGGSSGGSSGGGSSGGGSSGGGSSGGGGSGGGKK